MEEDDRHPITGDRIPDEGDLDSDGDDELLDGRSASHKSARSGSASLQSNTMLANLLDPAPAHEPFDEWESLPPKYLVSDSKTYLAYFKAFVGAGACLHRLCIAPRALHGCHSQVIDHLPSNSQASCVLPSALSLFRLTRLLF
jgi:hypothetical protein